ncbi:MAG: hypothetical protein ACXWB2_12865 [Acidimicrobiales bacterium]
MFPILPDDRAQRTERTMNPFPPPEPPPPAAGAASRRPGGAGAPAWEDLRRRRRTMRTTRWAMIGLGLLAGLGLIAAGATLAGSVIAGLALVRGLVMLTMGRRMQRRAPGAGRRRAPGPTEPPASATTPASAAAPPPASDPLAAGWAAPAGSPAPAAGAGAGAGIGGRTLGAAGAGDRPLQRLARRELGVAAAVIGVDVTELRRQRQAGRSIADVARDRGVDVDRVVQAVAADATSTIDRARRNGNPAAIGADASGARIATWASRFVEQRGGPGRSA